MANSAKNTVKTRDTTLYHNRIRNFFSTLPGLLINSLIEASKQNIRVLAPQMRVKLLVATRCLAGDSITSTAEKALLQSLLTNRRRPSLQQQPDFSNTSFLITRFLYGKLR